MADTIYRKAALDRLASPERLDAPLALVGRPAWLVLGAVAIALLAALGWAFATQAPVKVSASGVLIDRAGLAEIVAGEDGRIDRLLAAPGDQVRADQPIATLARPELRREIEEARSKLAGAQARYAQLQGFYGSQSTSQRGADAVRLATLADTRKALNERAAYLEQKARSMASLVERGFLQRDKLVEVQLELAGVRERIANLRETALRVGIEATARDGEQGLALLDQQRIIQDQSRAVELLSARLADQQVIRSPHAGRITELKVNAGDVVAPLWPRSRPMTTGADSRWCCTSRRPRASGSSRV